MSRPQGHIAAGRIMSMKKSNDTIGNRTRDLPTCSALPQPTALLRAPVVVLVVVMIVVAPAVLNTSSSSSSTEMKATAANS
jgi:chorismate synthase